MNTIKEIFSITNKNISLATPLILYSLFSSIYLAVSAFGSTANIFFAFLLFILMSVAFIAGWFYMIKQVILFPARENIASAFSFFPEGVGENFISVLGATLVFIVIHTILIMISIGIGAHFIGNPDVDMSALSNSLKSTTDLKLFLSGLSTTQLSKLGMWNILLLSSISLTDFLFILYFPILFFKNKNPLIAFCINIRELFGKKFFKTLLVYIIILGLYIISSVCTAIASGNIILHLFITLMNFYFIVLIFVGLFYYYFHNFTEKQTGQNIDIRI